jgi:hypothetical protein
MWHVARSGLDLAARGLRAPGDALPGRGASG